MPSFLIEWGVVKRSLFLPIASFDSLINQIRLILHLPAPQLSILYGDEEGDLCKITCDEELVSALMSISNKKDNNNNSNNGQQELTLYIQVTGMNNPTEDNIPTVPVPTVSLVDARILDELDNESNNMENENDNNKSRLWGIVESDFPHNNANENVDVEAGVKSSLSDPLLNSLTPPRTQTPEPNSQSQSQPQSPYNNNNNDKDKDNQAELELMLKSFKEKSGHLEAQLASMETIRNLIANETNIKIARLDKAIAEKNSALASLTEEINKLQAQISSLKALCAQKDKSIANHISIHSDLRAELAETNKKLKELSLGNSSSSTRLAELQSIITHTKSEHSKLENNLVIANTQIDSLQTSLNQIQAQNEDLSKRLESALAKIKELETQRLAENSKPTQVAQVDIKDKEQSNDSGKQLESPSDDEIVHKHVTCNRCKAGIVGRRYTCSVCYDFDLCSKCEDLNENFENHITTHPMILSKLPTRQSQITKYAFKANRLSRSSLNNTNKQDKQVENIISSQSSPAPSDSSNINSVDSPSSSSNDNLPVNSNSQNINAEAPKVPSSGDSSDSPKEKVNLSKSESPAPQASPESNLYQVNQSKSSPSLYEPESEVVDEEEKKFPESILPSLNDPPVAPAHKIFLRHLLSPPIDFFNTLLNPSHKLNSQPAPQQMPAPVANGADPLVPASAPVEQVQSQARAPAAGIVPSNGSATATYASVVKESAKVNFKAQLEEMKGLGLTEDQALDALIAYDGNVHRAINFIFDSMNNPLNH